MKTKLENLKILELDEKASNEDMKKAYRRLAKKYHPDLNRDDEKAERNFKEVGEAYDSLINPQKENQQRINPREWNFTTDMNSMFGRMRRPPSVNFDIKVKINLPLKSSLNGTSLKIKYPRKSECPDCSGIGSKDVNDTAKCPACNGSGKTISQSIFSSFISICGNCNGTGKIFKNKCIKCNGEGSVEKEREITLKIPKGTKDGNIIRCKNEGNQNRNEEFGDLLCFISLENNGFFKVLNNQQDIYIKMPIPFHIALLGGEIKIPTLHGEKNIKINPKTKHGDFVNVSNVGLQKNQNNLQFGSQIIEVEIEMPEKINDELKEELNKIIADKSVYPQYSKSLSS